MGEAMFKVINVKEMTIKTSKILSQLSKACLN